MESLLDFQIIVFSQLSSLHCIDFVLSISFNTPKLQVFIFAARMLHSPNWDVITLYTTIVQVFFFLTLLRRGPVTDRLDSKRHKKIPVWITPN